MRIGIIALLHESNTFSSQPTTIDSFRQDMLLTGDAVREALQHTHHEVGGFFEGVNAAGTTAVPLFAARTLPSGTVSTEAFEQLIQQLQESVDDAGELDGMLVAPHGATVSKKYPDADGEWLKRLRAQVGANVPIIGTLDAHANLSEAMVSACNALIAYRTNPHLDQRERGIEAARLLVRTIRGKVRPMMSAVVPPLAISIERQCTDESHLQPLYHLADEQLRNDAVLTNSILLGFPYADVAEMGSAVVTVTDDDSELGHQLSRQLAETMWDIRSDLHGEFVSVAEALDHCQSVDEPVCLLDMGDNVGGGSSADGTELVAEIHRRGTGPAFACLFDPDCVKTCDDAGVGKRVSLRVGGHTDDIHGEPVSVEVTIKSLHDGRFREPEPRHGGMTEFDQGRTAVCATDTGLTLMLTSRRMVPFSLQQLISCGLQPDRFRLLVAKGVNAPIAAYREVCPRFIRVNTKGSTCADMNRLQYGHRRRPLFPLELDTTWSGTNSRVIRGHECK